MRRKKLEKQERKRLQAPIYVFWRFFLIKKNARSQRFIFLIKFAPTLASTYSFLCICLVFIVLLCIVMYYLVHWGFNVAPTLASTCFSKSPLQSGCDIRNILPKVYLTCTHCVPKNFLFFQAQREAWRSTNLN